MLEGKKDKGKKEENKKFLASEAACGGKKAGERQQKQSAALKKVTSERLERMLGKSIRQDIVDRFFWELRDSLISIFQPQRGLAQPPD
ncbi:unnamed protein product [Orchesella dallaii]|uniref:Uncharacterized protein n=1 Tax=Orchesella dallaii TaxID=48710 RepID=A0ABP1RL11_9HEXA